MGKYRIKLEDFRCKWKKSAAGAVIYILLIVPCLIFFGLGMSQRQELEGYDSRVTLIRRDGEGYSFSGAKQMRMGNREADESLAYVLWGNGGVRLLQNEDLGRYAEAEIYVVEGSSGLLLSSGAILDGTLGSCCLVGEEVALELFGVSDATGLSVTMDGCAYLVTGMLGDAGEAAVFQSCDLTDFPLDRMTVLDSGDISLYSLEQKVLGQTGFTGTALDYRFINSLVGVPGLGLCTLVWIWLLRMMVGELSTFRKEYAEKRRESGYSYRKTDPVYIRGIVIRLGCIAGVVIVFGIFLRFQAEIPADMIPTKWSDFEFWRRLADEKAERFLEWIRCEKGVPELLYLGKTVRATLCFTLSYLCYFLLRAVRYGRNMGRK